MIDKTSVQFGDFVIDLSAYKLRFVGEKPKTREEAWKITIEKWHTLSRVKHDIFIYDGSNSTCGLCMLYFGCDGCPIALDGYPRCERTPYVDYRKAADSKTARAAATVELKYLKKLYKKENVK